MTEYLTSFYGLCICTLLTHMQSLYIYIYTCTHMHVNTCLIYTHNTCTHACVHACTHTHTRMCTYACIHTYLHMHICTHTHVHTPGHISPHHTYKHLCPSPELPRIQFFSSERWQCWASSTADYFRLTIIYFGSR